MVINEICAAQEWDEQRNHEHQNLGDNEALIKWQMIEDYEVKQEGLMRENHEAEDGSERQTTSSHHEDKLERAAESCRDHQKRKDGKGGPDELLFVKKAEQHQARSQSQRETAVLIVEKNEEACEGQ